MVVWEEPDRVVFRSRGEHPMAYEWLVEAADGGSCVVRLVSSGFGSGPEWDAQFDGMSEGWRIFLANLELQLTHFRGLRALASVPTLMVPGPRADAWATLCEAMEIPPEADEGEVIDTGGAAPPLVATVASTWETSGARAYHLLLTEPGPGTGFVVVEGEGDELAASVYLYLYDTEPGEVERLERRWLEWMEERFLPIEERLKRQKT